MGLGAAALALAAALPVESRLWGIAWSLPGLDLLGAVPAWTVVCALVLGWILEARLLVRLVEERTAATPDLRWPLRALRFVSLGAPGLGLTTVGIWCRIDPAKLPWAFLAADAGSDGRRRALHLTDRDSRAGPAELEGRAFWGWLAGVGLLELAAVWLSAPVSPSPGRRLALLGLAASLHLFGFAGMAVYGAISEGGAWAEPPSPSRRLGSCPCRCRCCPSDSWCWTPIPGERRRSSAPPSFIGATSISCRAGSLFAGRSTSHGSTRRGGADGDGPRAEPSARVSRDRSGRSPVWRG